MLLHRTDLDKVRMGLFKCPTCERYYDPTATGGPCPYCSRKYNLATIAFAIVLLLFLLLWLPLESAAKAQEVPPETPQISATWWLPTPTPILSPPFEPTDTPVIIPIPQHYVWLPVVAK